MHIFQRRPATADNPINLFFGQIGFAWRSGVFQVCRLVWRVRSPERSPGEVRPTGVYRQRSTGFFTLAEKGNGTFAPMRAEW